MSKIIKMSFLFLIFSASLLAQDFPQDPTTTTQDDTYFGTCVADSYDGSYTLSAVFKFAQDSLVGTIEIARLSNVYGGRNGFRFSTSLTPENIKLTKVMGQKSYVVQFMDSRTDNEFKLVVPTRMSVDTEGTPGELWFNDASYDVKCTPEIDIYK